MVTLPQPHPPGRFQLLQLKLCIHQILTPHWLLPPVPGNHPSILSPLINVTSLSGLLWVASDNTCPFVAALLDLAQSPCRSSMLSHMSEFPSFLRRDNMPLYVLFIVIHLSVDTWVDFTFWLLWIKNLGHGRYYRENMQKNVFLSTIYWLYVLSKICSIEYILTSHFMLRWKINYQSKLSYIFSKASALITVYHPLQKLPWKR